jgi:1,2-phenylacetyl-CoA epoxidase PaaB subunit
MSPRPVSSTQVWEVFARQEYGQPLHHVGAVTEDDEDLALVCARSIYDEQPWIEMIIVPRSAIRQAIRA